MQIVFVFPAHSVKLLLLLKHYVRGELFLLFEQKQM
jgi:hypothetical protein